MLSCGDEVAGLIRGSHYLGNYVVSRIEFRQDLAAFSPGVMVLHMAIEDLIVHGPTRLINFGFGEPNRKHHPFNVVHQYGTVILLRRTLANRLRWLSHRSFRSLLSTAKRSFIRDRCVPYKGDGDRDLGDAAPSEPLADSGSHAGSPSRGFSRSILCAAVRRVFFNRLRPCTPGPGAD